jgi:hypothetical protein
MKSQSERERNVRRKEERKAHLSISFTPLSMQSLRAAMEQRHCVRLRPTAAVHSTALRNTVEIVSPLCLLLCESSLSLSLNPTLFGATLLSLAPPPFQDVCLMAHAVCLGRPTLLALLCQTRKPQSLLSLLLLAVSPSLRLTRSRSCDPYCDRSLALADTYLSSWLCLLFAISIL